jgi:sulfatase maturation enzyme AslB (radical SAM superfamily)
MDFKTADMTAKFLLSNAIPNKIIPGFTFFGGEPLLKFEEIIKPLVLKYKDSFGWSITTNGTLLTEEIIDFCYDNKISILLSLDGGEII